MKPKSNRRTQTKKKHTKTKTAFIKKTKSKRALTNKKMSKKMSKLMNHLSHQKEDYDILEKLYDELHQIDRKNPKYNKIYNQIMQLNKKIGNKKKGYYPSIYDNKFNKKIAEIPDFSIFKTTIDDYAYKQLYENFQNNTKFSVKKNQDVFQLSNTQKLLTNFMSEFTPYYGLLIVHGTGVGKTCAAVSIAENLKHIIYDNKKKIHVIKAKEIKKQLFDINKVINKTPKNQCTRDEYIKHLKDTDLIQNCQKNKANCPIIEVSVKKKINNYYEFSNIEAWAKKVYSLINKHTNNKTKDQAQKIKQKIIHREFSDSIIIIDEAHHINDITNNTKLISKVLEDVLTYSNNLRLIMLTATPMFDKASDFLSLINYLLINDRRKKISRDEIFDKKEKLIPSGEKMLIEKTNGYISFLRGNNPFSFPIRLSSKYNSSSKLIDYKNYPKLLLDTNLNYKSHIIDIIDCPMTNIQKDVYLKNIELSSKLESDASAAWNTESQISNFVYQSFKDSGNNIKLCYGETGFNEIFYSKKNMNYFKNEKDAKLFLIDNIQNHSSKIHRILQTIKKSKGPVFIFSRYIKGGLIPIVIALEMNGYKHYKGNDYIKSDYKSQDYQGDYIIKTGSSENYSNIESYLNMRENMVNEPVKVFLGTTAASEGFSLFGYRETHILEPHFNLSLLEQVIGRVIRYESHKHLPPKERNVTVYHYASTIKNQETVDLYKYRLSEQKAVTSGNIMKLLKENAIDCHLNYDLNNNSDNKYLNKLVGITTSQNKNIEIKLKDHEYQQECHYMKNCDFNCNSPSPKIIPSNQNKMLLSSIKNNIVECAELIINLFNTIYVISIEDLIKKMLPVVKNENVIHLSIFYICDNKEIFKNNKGQEGFIEKINDKLKFVPLNNEYIDLELNQLIGPKQIKLDSVDLSNYLVDLEKEYSDILVFDEFDLEEILISLYDKTISISKIVSQQTIIEDKKKKLLIILKILVDKLDFKTKLYLIKQIYFYKFNKLSIKNQTQINNNEKMAELMPLLKIIVQYFTLNVNDVFYNSKLKTFYGFILMNEENEIDVYVYNSKDFILDNSNNKTIKELKSNIISKKNMNKVYGYSIYNTKKQMQFKIIDQTLDQKKSRTGEICNTLGKNRLLKYIHIINKKYKLGKKKESCVNLLYILYCLDYLEYENQKWFLYPEEYGIIN